MFTRRKVLTGLAAALAAGAVAPAAFARDDELLLDILDGVTDALIRDYIRDNYRHGRWDGSYWWYDGRRYTPAEYRRYFCDEYDRRHPKRRRKPHPHAPGGKHWDDDCRHDCYRDDRRRRRRRDDDDDDDDD